MKKKKIFLPINDNDVETLEAGDNVLLNGEIYVARDAAHKRLIDLIDNNKNLPFEIKNSVIYYMGPTPTPNGKVIGSAGPTTSHRMDKYTPKLLDLGLKATIGKGKRSLEVIESMKKNKAVYFSAIGGTGALLNQSILKNEIIEYEDLGPEALRKITVKDFPVIVSIDSNGKSLFEIERAKYRDKFKLEV